MTMLFLSLADSSDWSPRSLIVPIAVFAVLSLLAWSSRSASSQQRPPLLPSSRVLTYKRVPKALVIVFFLLPITLGLAALLGLIKGATGAGIVVLFMLSLPFLLLLIELYGLRITWTDDVIVIFSPWRHSSRKILMHEIRRCDYSEHWQCYRIHTRRYGRTHLSIYLKNLDALLKTLP